MEERKRTARSLRAEASKEKLQQIVLDMTRTKTLDEIRIKDICERADMSLGNFYQYFPSKESALIYSYKTKDDLWLEEHFEDVADPLDRVKRILSVHLHSMVENSLCFDAQLYIAQLKIYDGYFFTADRYLHRVMREAVTEGQAAGEFLPQNDPHTVTMKLLNFSRGLVYNYCIAHNEAPEEWLRYAKECQSEYLTLFLTEASKGRSVLD